MNWEAFGERWIRVAEITTSRYFLIAGGAFLVFYFFLKNPLIHRRMQSKFPQSKHYYRDILYSLLTILIFATMAALVFVVLRPYTQLYEPANAYGMFYYFLTFPMMFFVHDFYFYSIHRLMHVPKFFRLIHRVHHLSTNPSPWTAYAFHPLEAVLEAGIIPLIAFSFPVHPAALGLFLLFQFFYNVYGHLGFELFPKNFQRTWVGKWVNTGTAHNQHHEHFHGNYGLYTLIWDRIFGTLRDDYETKFDEVTLPKTNSKQ
ncbi:sterol desaturase family protein [Algoriphagus kandeliae]|uniref:Sterol desaturase family protein n=1 Tax=Algoriphagus kandeliae TaxID=2562278 RepID=A0A4Y9QL94_9BACT|nr:sterol desaturase family protein [Algoriphagus kandeliae]TFV93449.1 sterol desaturase family protein [Algoriphagus kandeliae]